MNLRAFVFVSSLVFTENEFNRWLLFSLSLSIVCLINSEIVAKASSPAKDTSRSAQPVTYGVYGPPVEGEPNTFQMLRHSQIIQQCSSSTDEGCDTDHGEMEDVIQASVPPSIQRLNSYASSSSSSGVVTNFPSKSLSQNLSCDSSRSNFSTFESLDLNLSDCSDLAASLPSCATTLVNAINENAKEHGKLLSYHFQATCSENINQHILSI